MPMNKIVKPIHVGIIDSGIDRRFVKEYGLNITRCASISMKPEDNKIVMLDFDQEDIKNWMDEKTDRVTGISDENGHGTAVASIIRINYPDALFSTAKVLEEDNKGYSHCLVEAMKWMVRVIKPDVINMSLGTTDESVKNTIRYLALEAMQRGTIITAASSAFISYPAALPEVYSVGFNSGSVPNYHPIMKDNISHFIEQKNVQVWSNGQYRDSCMSNSYACPMVINDNLIKLTSAEIRLRFRIISANKAFLFIRKNGLEAYAPQELDFIVLKADKLKYSQLLGMKNMKSLDVIEQMGINSKYNLMNCLEKDNYYYNYSELRKGSYYMALIAAKFDRKILARSGIMAYRQVEI